MTGYLSILWLFVLTKRSTETRFAAIVMCIPDKVGIGMVTVGPMALHRGCGGPRVVSRFLTQSLSLERTQRLKHC